MRIAFDAKRAFQNNTGLGHYSRTLLNSLFSDYPQHQYFLMAPKRTGLYHPEEPNVQVITPTGIGKTFRSLWRSNWVKQDLKQLNIDLYHGLSHEIPIGIDQTRIKSVVTIHDLIFERYPAQYKAIDVAIYRSKFRYACRHADKVIAISKQTREDLVSFYNVPEDKIEICYQACNPVFQHLHTPEEKLAIRKKYNLPETYFLYVGTVIERKNLLNICKALHSLKGKLDIPLVVIGGGNDSYAVKVKDYIQQNGLKEQVIFLTDDPVAQNSEDFRSAKDFPAIYQSARAMIYPSVYEGFGLPVLEALWSGTPVITSNTSCLPETGGDAAYYVDPLQPAEIAQAMLAIATASKLADTMKDKGITHAQKFLPSACASAVMSVYESLI
jgi:glycosyltransferase involved in cell wall biosynthesis